MDSSPTQSHNSQQDERARIIAGLQAELKSLETSHQPESFYRAGCIYHQLGQAEQALEFLERAAAHAPLLARARARQATILRQLERPKESFPMALQAIRADALVAEGWECAGFLLIGSKKWAEASNLLAMAIQAIPENAALHAYYALALAKNGDPVAAYPHVQHAMKLEPDSVIAIMARIEVFCEAGYYDLALRDTALLQDKDIPNSATFGFGSMAFITGDYARGLKALTPVINSGWRGGDIPEWNGTNVPDRHVVFYGGQGYGDMMQFVRYIDDLRPRIGKALLHIPRNLTRLMRDSFPDLPLSIHEDDANINSIPMPSDVSIGLPYDMDLRCSLPSLVTFTENGFDAMAGKVPYLKTDPNLSHIWRERLKDLPRPWIGLVWAPGTWFNSNPCRTVAYEALRPIVELARRHLISLQLGDEAVHPVKDGVYDASPFISDFADTAALMNELDLVITLDSAPSHLAGALGKPVWTMLHYNADWRWLVGREDSIWYPSMRLFRQMKPQDWSDAIARIAVDLKCLLAGDKSVLYPKPWIGPTPVRSPNALQIPF